MPGVFKPASIDASVVATAAHAAITERARAERGPAHRLRWKTRAHALVA